MKKFHEQMVKNVKVIMTNKDKNKEERYQVKRTKKHTND